jgi:UDP-N-acetylglucosamine--N-acetylmuramyl-(pentapeptide) pyrophosphoryl-undecaprenol N-acetylglucosamine transferase
MEEKIVPDYGIAMENVSMRGVQPEPWKNIPLVYLLPAAVASASRLISRFEPDVVFGTGGYVVAAVGAAALLARRPLYLQLPDAVPGRAIRTLGPRARTVFSAYAKTAELMPRARVELTGTPVRPELLEPRRRVSGELRNLLVFGGSQGAHRLNVAMAEAVKTLLERPRLHITHITGTPDHDWLRSFRSGLEPDDARRYVVEPFAADFVSLLRKADLVVSRAGGSSIAEMTALGLPMILVPYPFAGGHQRFNAEPAASAGAAVVVPDEELSGVRLASEVARLADDPERLRRMSAAGLGLSHPDAAQRIAHTLLGAARR